MNAKERLIDFLRKAPHAEDKKYKFDVLGDGAEAKSFVHRMRVELSRLRAELRDRNKQVRPFKMLMVSVEPSPTNQHYQQITLQFQQAKSDTVSREVSEVFNVLSTGDNMLDEKSARGLRKQNIG